MNMTDSQAERQKHRERGKYAKVNPCCGCGRSAGVDFFSHPMSDQVGPDGEPWHDSALVLCGRCSKATEAIVNVSDFRVWRKRRADRATGIPNG